MSSAYPVVMSNKQAESYVKATHRFNIWVGAVRSGKTYSSIRAFIDFMKNGPPGDAMIVGVNRVTIQRNVLTTMYKILGFPCPSQMCNKTDLYGRDLYFVGAPDVSAVTTIQGSTLAMAYVDEATCIPEPFWQMLETRLSVPKARLYATCNPEGPAHWLKKEYIDRKNIHDIITWHFSLDDNPILDEDYKKAIKASFSGMFYRRYILGEWALAHGAVYDNYDHDNEFENPYPSPNYYIVGLDYGTTNATAAVSAQLRQRNGLKCVLKLNIIMIRLRKEDLKQMQSLLKTSKISSVIAMSPLFILIRRQHLLRSLLDRLTFQYWTLIMMCFSVSRPALNLFQGKI